MGLVLDDVDEAMLAKVDRANMMGAVLSFPAQLDAVLAKAGSITLPESHKRFENVLITGLGGSAIGGDYAAHWAERVARVPVAVNRTYDLPKWVGPNTLVIASSYSGNTEETLSAFAEARHRGAKLVAIATGGKMQEFAARASAPFVPLPPGLQPRAALPTGFSTVALVLEAAGVLPKARDELAIGAKLVREMAPEFGVDKSPPRNYGKLLAMALGDTIPVVYAADHLVPAARRFANQLNENSKILAFWGAMPEMNHNELVGWDGDAEASRFTAVFLRHAREREQVKARFDYTAALVQRVGGQVVQIEARGATPAPELLSTTFVGDVASVLLAALRGVDPSPVPPISGLKDEVGKLGLARELEAKLG